MKKTSESRISRIPYGISWIANSLYALFFEFPFVFGYIVYIDKTRDYIPFLKGPDMVDYRILVCSLSGLIALNTVIVFLCRIAKIKPTDTRLYWNVTVACATMPYILFICYGIAYFIRFGTLF